MAQVINFTISFGFNGIGINWSTQKVNSLSLFNATNNNFTNWSVRFLCPLHIFMPFELYHEYKSTIRFFSYYIINYRIYTIGHCPISSVIIWLSSLHTNAIFITITLAIILFSSLRFTLYYYCLPSYPLASFILFITPLLFLHVIMSIIIFTSLLTDTLRFSAYFFNKPTIHSFRPFVLSFFIPAFVHFQLIQYRPIRHHWQPIFLSPFVHYFAYVHIRCPPTTFSSFSSGPVVSSFLLLHFFFQNVYLCSYFQLSYAIRIIFAISTVHLDAFIHCASIFRYISLLLFISGPLFFIIFFIRTIIQLFSSAFFRHRAHYYFTYSSSFLVFSFLSDHIHIVVRHYYY